MLSLGLGFGLGGVVGQVLCADCVGYALFSEGRFAVVGLGGVGDGLGPF